MLMLIMFLPITSWQNKVTLLSGTQYWVSFRAHSASPTLKSMLKMALSRNLIEVPVTRNLSEEQVYFSQCSFPAGFFFTIWDWKLVLKYPHGWAVCSCEVCVSLMRVPLLVTQRPSSHHQNWHMLLLTLTN